MNNIDKFTKVILAVIALALSVIALTPWLQPVTVSAAPQDYLMRRIESAVGGIEFTVGGIKRELESLSSGLCLNSKIC